MSEAPRPARDSKRIAYVLHLLAHYWRRHPDLRLGQIIGNAARARRLDPYGMEDDDLALALEDGLWMDPVLPAAQPELVDEGHPQDEPPRA